MSQNFTAHFADIFASISQIFGAFAATVYGQLNGLLQKVGGCSDKMSGNGNTFGKSQKVKLSGGSLKSGLLSNPVSTIKTISLALMQNPPHGLKQLADSGLPEVTGVMVFQQLMMMLPLTVLSLLHLLLYLLSA
jgi:hypothetical protein